MHAGSDRVDQFRRVGVQEIGVYLVQVGTDFGDLIAELPERFRQGRGQWRLCMSRSIWRRLGG